MIYQIQTVKSFKTKTITVPLNKSNELPRIITTNCGFNFSSSRFLKPKLLFADLSEKPLKTDLDHTSNHKNSIPTKVFKSFSAMQTTGVRDTKDETEIKNKLFTQTRVNFTDLILKNPPCIPSYLFTSQNSEYKQKSRIMIRVNRDTKLLNSQDLTNESNYYLSVDQLTKKLSVIYEYDEGPAQKQYTFDEVFTNSHDFQTDICNSILNSNDLIQSVLTGSNVCIFTYGQSEQEKLNTMFGSDRSCQMLGVVPLSLVYIFELLEQRRACFKVNISAMEIVGDEEKCVDLIRDKRVILPEVDLKGVNIMEFSGRFECSNLQKALGYMDLALNNSDISNDKKHQVIVIYIKQQILSSSFNSVSIESKMTFINFGHLQSRQPNQECPILSPVPRSLSIQQLSHAIKCCLNGQANNLRYMQSRLTKIVSQTMTDSLVNMIAHINENSKNEEMYQVIQLSSKILKKTRTSKQSAKALINDTTTKIINPEMTIQKSPYDSPDAFTSDDATIIYIDSPYLNSTLITESDTGTNNNQHHPRIQRTNQIKLGLSYKNRSSSNNNKTSKEVWIDGPKSNNNTAIKKPINAILSELNLNEIWIDGPNASINHSAQKQQQQQQQNQKQETSLQQITSYFDIIKERYSTHQFTMNNNKDKNEAHSKSSDSLECLDRQLLRQLNEHDATIENALRAESSNHNHNNNQADYEPSDTESRPISLLSFHSTNNDPISNSMKTLTSTATCEDSEDDVSLTENDIQQKLDDLKHSSGQMIFRQTSREMESLHRTLETILNTGQLMQMKPVNRTIIAPAIDLTKEFMKHDHSDTKNKCIGSRNLSSSRFRPFSVPEVQFERPSIESDKPKHLSVSSIVSTSSSNNSTSTNSSLSQSPNSTSCEVSHYATPLLHSSPIQKPVLQYQLESTNIESESETYSDPFDNINHSNLNRLVSPVRCNNNQITIKNISRNWEPPKIRIPTPMKNSSNNNNRLFYNFNNNSNNLAISLPGTPLHATTHQSKPNKINKKYQHIYKADSHSVPSSPNYSRRSSIKTQKEPNQPQPVIKILKQTASKLTGSVTGGCGGMLGSSSMENSNSISSIAYSRKSKYADTTQATNLKKESILNKIFKRSKSKDVQQEFSHHQKRMEDKEKDVMRHKGYACFGLSSSSPAKCITKNINENGIRKSMFNENSSSGYESFINESHDESSEYVPSNNGYFNRPFIRDHTLQRRKTEQIC